MSDDAPAVGRPRQTLFALVLIGVPLAAAATVLRGFEAGGVVLGATLAAGAVVRMVVPARWAGGLANRSRVVDVAVMLALGAALVVLGQTVPVPQETVAP